MCVHVKTSILLSIAVAPVYFLTNSVQGFPFLHILTNTGYLCVVVVFDYGHSDMCEVISQCGFDWHFSDD